MLNYSLISHINFHSVFPYQDIQNETFELTGLNEVSTDFVDESHMLVVLYLSYVDCYEITIY